jgi:thioredoxin reductase
MAAPSESIFDVLIIGGGPAGHAAAVSVARNIHTTVVFDSHEYRNERSKHMHIVPTLDGTHPQAFRDAAKANTTEHYDFISFVDTKIVNAKKDGELFIVSDTEGKRWNGRSLILATGGEDVMLDISGFFECWGRSM